MSVEKNRKKIHAALFSSAASLLMTVGKFVVGTLTGSVGILAEAIHSLVDFAATIITYFAVKISGEPADHNHHYGHDKVESLAALVETGLLFATSFWIVYEVIKRLLGTSSHTTEVTWYALGVIIVSIAIDFNRSRSLMKVAHETGSHALEADALHFTSDMYSSLAVLVGLLFTYAGFPYGDPIAALVVSLMIFKAGGELGRRSLAILMDEAPEGVSAEICALTKKVEGVITVRNVNVRPLGGREIFTDLHVILAPHLSLENAAVIKRNIVKKIEEKFEGAQIVVHIDTK